MQRKSIENVAFEDSRQAQSEWAFKFGDGMTKDSANMPLFVHSLFRSGSTYIFQAFRRAARDGSPIFTAYQEPIHEIAINSRDNPSALLALPGTGEGQRASRHPQMSEPYFKELYDAYPAWHDIVDEQIIYADYFGLCAIDKTMAYLQALVSASPRRPVLQDCRTALRMTPLRQHLGGVHIYLWRNPWDQWWSLKATDYFDTAHQVILNAPVVPPAITALQNFIGFERCPDSEIAKQFHYYSRRRPPSDVSYLTFFSLWSLALLEARRTADFDINIDLLSVSEEYRELKLEQLRKAGVDSIDFSDCHVPQAPYGKNDEMFFRPLEKRVSELLSSGGVSHEELSSLDQFSQQTLPSRISNKGRGLRAEEELYRLREVLRRLESRESAQSVQWKQEVARANVRELWLENEWKAAKASTDYQEAQAKVEIQRLIQTFSAREQELADQLLRGETDRERMSQAFASRESELGVLLAKKQDELQNLTATLANREREIGEQLTRKEAQLQNLTGTLVSREHEFSSLLSRKQDELQKLMGTLASREHEFSSLLARKQDELQQLMTTLAARERDLGSQLVGKQEELQRLTSTLVASEKLGAKADLKLREMQRMVTNLGAREHELGAELGRKQDELQQLTATLAAREQALGAELGKKQDELQQLAAASVARENALTTELGRIQDELTASLARGQWLENEWNAAKAKIHELNYHSHTWWLKADAAARDLQTVFASRSWRVTAPLRNAQHFVQVCWHKAESGAKNSRGAVRRIAARALQRGLNYCNAHPRLKILARKILNGFPFLDARIRALLPGADKLPHTPDLDLQVQVAHVVIQTEPQVMPAEPCSVDLVEDGITQDLRKAIHGWPLGSRVDA